MSDDARDDWPFGNNSVSEDLAEARADLTSARARIAELEAENGRLKEALKAAVRWCPQCEGEIAYFTGHAGYTSEEICPRCGHLRLVLTPPASTGNTTEPTP